jgi:4-hydroxybenzoate polyprenyltransferase
MPALRTWLILGRVSNLPTVWSNCLAGWWLGGGGNFLKLPFLFIGVSLLYLGGMFLNDAFDEAFDQQHR